MSFSLMQKQNDAASRLSSYTGLESVVFTIKSVLCHCSHTKHSMYFRVNKPVCHLFTGEILVCSSLLDSGQREGAKNLDTRLV
jgi:hypothetical protein